MCCDTSKYPCRDTENFMLFLIILSPFLKFHNLHDLPRFERHFARNLSRPFDRKTSAGQTWIAASDLSDLYLAPVSKAGCPKWRALTFVSGLPPQTICQRVAALFPESSFHGLGGSYGCIGRGAGAEAEALAKVCVWELGPLGESEDQRLRGSRGQEIRNGKSK